MEYAKIPYIEKKVPRILFGTAMEPFLSGGNGNALLDEIFEAGITAFDTARNYKDAELSLGRWIEERGNRSDIAILSKCCHPDVAGRKRVNEKAIREDFALSAKNLSTNYIDIYLLHRDDPEAEIAPIVETLNAMHVEGKIGAFGGSNWTHQRIEEANEYAYKRGLIPFTVSSPNFSLAEQVQDPWGGGCVTISGEANEQAREWYRKSQMPVIAYSSLGRGLFSGKVKSAEPEKACEAMDAPAVKGYCSPDNFERLRRCEILAARKGCAVAQIAMAWIFRQNMNVFAVVSTTNASRMKDNIAALDIELTAKESQYLDLRLPSI